MQFNQAKINSEFKERIKDSTTPPFWKKVRNISGIVSVIGATILTSGLALPAWLATTISITTGVAGAISGRAHMTKRR